MTPYRMSTSFASVTSMVFTKNWPLKTDHLLNQARHLVELGTILCDRIRPLQKLAPKNSESSLVYDASNASAPEINIVKEGSLSWWQ